MNVVVCTVLLLAVFTKADGDNDNWPNYMRKCEKSSADLESCLVLNANQALDGVMKGDPTIGIPRYNEYYLGKAFFGQNKTYKLYVDDAVIYGLKHLSVSGFKWNFDQKTVNIKFHHNNAVIIYGKYFSNGTFKEIDCIGEGKISMIFIGGSDGKNLTYNMNYELLNVSGRDFVQIKERTCTHTSGYRVDGFSTLKPQAEVFAAAMFLNQHSKELEQSIVVEMNDIICRLVSQALNAVFHNFPLDLIFDN